MQAVLEMKGMYKSFPGVKALDNIDFTVLPGTVHALMGENGAGKSTLMKCAFGIYQPDEGTIAINGEATELKSARDAMAKGIAMIHQELQPIYTQSVMENIWVGRIPYKKIGPVKFVNSKKMHRDTVDLFEKIKVDIDPRAPVQALNTSQCQLLEIARAISLDAKVIIMDEPTSSLTEKEAGLLFEIIRSLTATGVAIIYISHKLEEILQISDEVTVMRDGTLVGTWPAGEMTQDSIVSKMVGRDMENRFPEKTNTPGDTRLVVRNASAQAAHSFKDISFELRKGEILGIGGLVGAQRTELMEAIFGLRRLSGGEISLDGTPVQIHSPRGAIAHGIALLTEERRVNGIIPVLSVMENTTLANQTVRPAEYRGALGLLKAETRKTQAREYVKKLAIKTPSIQTQIKYLSGGNQQKVLLARWLLTSPEILILDEPTRGIDVGAKHEIYSIMNRLVCEGKSIIMISSEMPELLGMSDRIMVMCEGRLSGILARQEATEEKIMHLASSYQ